MRRTLQSLCQKNWLWRDTRLEKKSRDNLKEKRKKKKMCDRSQTTTEKKKEGVRLGEWR